MKQCLDALAKANTRRLVAANLKTEIHDASRPAGAARVAAFLRNPDPECDHVHVDALLLAIRALGPVKVNKLLVVARVGLVRTRSPVRDLTYRQRAALADQLDAIAVREWNRS